MALLGGVVILAGIVWAKAIQTPVSGKYTNLHVTGPPRDVWFDDEGRTLVSLDSEC